MRSPICGARAAGVMCVRVAVAVAHPEGLGEIGLVGPCLLRQQDGVRHVGALGGHLGTQGRRGGGSQTTNLTMTGCGTGRPHLGGM